jgi:hypothetical protein
MNKIERSGPSEQDDAQGYVSPVVVAIGIGMLTNAAYDIVKSDAFTKSIDINALMEQMR